jgi:hypothetical protein
MAVPGPDCPGAILAVSRSARQTVSTVTTPGGIFR